MQNVRWNQGVRALGLALALVPTAYLGAHASGVPEAEACTGGQGSGAATAPPTTAKLHRNPGGAPMEVATDGFFLIDTYFSEPDPAIIGSGLVVTTADGAPVAGELKLYSGGASYLGWQAKAPLPIGTHLKIRLTPTPGIPYEDSADAVVVGEPTPLDSATLTFGAWYQLNHGYGTPFTCDLTPPPYPCGGRFYLTVFENEVEVPEVALSWTGPARINGFVLWEGAIVPDTNQLTPESLSLGPVFSQSDQPKALGRLVFTADAAEHCATLSVRDLRTGQVVTSKQCGQVTEAVPDGDHADVAACATPPSSEKLAQQWCAAHPESKLAPCAQDADPSSTPAPSTTPNEGTTPTPNNDAASPPRTSSSCQLSPGPARGAALSLALVGLGLMGLARRRRWGGRLS